LQNKQALRAMSKSTSVVFTESKPLAGHLRLGNPLPRQKRKKKEWFECIALLLSPTAD
jgi:hypothetical protein